MSNATLQFIWIIFRAAIRRSPGVAAGFWILWLILVCLELTFGPGPAWGATYAMSIPILVLLLIWTTRHVLVLGDRRVLSLWLLSLTVLVFSAAIIAAGMSATIGLRMLVQG